MTNLHTPAPWKIHRMENHHSGVPDIYQIHWSDIGECVAEIVHGEANARLIAAAPEMLEALEKLARLGNGEMYGNSLGNTIARAAIGRAKKD
jgi:aryl-alcohol dehydrogenase-like predicted oxidoreductase